MTQPDGKAASAVHASGPDERTVAPVPYVPRMDPSSPERLVRVVTDRGNPEKAVHASASYQRDKVIVGFEDGRVLEFDAGQLRRIADAQPVR